MNGQFTNPAPQIYGDGIFANYVRNSKNASGNALAAALQADADKKKSMQNPGGKSYATSKLEEAGKMGAGYVSGLANVLAGVSQGHDANKQKEYDAYKNEKLANAMATGDASSAVEFDADLAKTLAENNLKKQQAAEKMAFDKEMNQSNQDYDYQKVLGSYGQQSKENAAQRKLQWDIANLKDASAGGGDDKTIAGMPEKAFYELYNKLSPKDQAQVLQKPDLIHASKNRGFFGSKLGAGKHSAVLGKGAPQTAQNPYASKYGF
ncbi:MAG: hypothetical protein LBV16_06975 [Elusimicrobiota bacterium]|nr:hypothetical protein [Elusimicrobiota bacterium]